MSDIENIQGSAVYVFGTGEPQDENFQRFEDDLIALAKAEANKSPQKSSVRQLVANQLNLGFSQEQINHLIHAVTQAVSLNVAKEVVEGLSVDENSKRLCEERLRIEKAKIDAAQDGANVSQHIQDYGITDQEALIEIAKIAAAQDGGEVFFFIQKYGITDEDARIEIAKIAAAQNGWGTSEWIQNYGITNPKALVEIAKIAAAETGWRTSEFIQKYGITDEKDLIEIAKIAAARDGWGTSEWIQNYGIKDENARIEIALIAAAQNGGGTSEQIQNYGIKDKEALIKIAKIAAAQDGAGVSFFIQKYGIADEDTRIEIAKIAAAQNGWDTSRYFKNYGITEEKARIEIALIAAAQNGGRNSQLIQNYSITDQDALIKIALISAAQNGGGTSEHIQKYGITDQEALIEIAKTAAAQDRGEVSFFIQKYGITDEDARIEIAKIAAAQNGWGTSEWIQNYGITNPKALVEIAMIAAAETGWRTSEFIQKYGITDEKDLIEIAKIAAARDGWGTSEWIQNYGITDEEALIEIALIAAAKNGGGTSEQIQNYGIKDKEALIKIAKIAAAQDGGGVSFFIQKYGITDEDARIEIAKIAAAEYGWGTSLYFQNYGITEEKARIEIALIAAAQNGWGTSENIQNYGITDEKVLYQIFLTALGSDAASFKNMSKFISGESKQRYIPEGSPEYLEEDFAATRFVLEKMLSRDGNDPLTLALLKMRNPVARKMALQFIARNSALLKNKELKKPAEIAITVMNELRGAKLQVTKRDLSNDLLPQQMLITYHDLIEAEQLNNEQVVHLLDLVSQQSSSEKKIKELQKISALIAFDRVDLLKTTDNLGSSLEAAFKEAFGLKDIENFVGKFTDTFQKFRDPQALFIYCGRLKKLPEPDRSAVLVDLRVYIEDVLDKKFQTKRAEGVAAKLRERWTLGASKKIVLTGSTQSFDFKELLRIKIREGHISNDVIERVTPFLENKEPLPQDLKSYEKELILLAREGLTHLQPLEAALQEYKGDEQEIKNDVAAWIQAAKVQSGGNKEYTLLDSDDPCDFLLMGTEVGGSCQRVDGDPERNKGLVGTMLDGHNRLLLLKTPDGKIAGRALLRLVEEQGKPALFLERIYPQTLGTAEQKALLEFAKERSRAHRWPLYGVEFDGTPISTTLTSKGGRGAYQYIDSAGGIKEKGIFEIKNPKLLSPVNHDIR